LGPLFGYKMVDVNLPQPIRRSMRINKDYHIQTI
jgi:hypothetical protein